MKVNLKSRLQFALDIIRSAGKITADYFGNDKVKTEDKKDGSPVTIADRASEEFLRKKIELAFPEDAIVGEEFGKKEGKSGLTWYLDPIDGTQSFVCKAPFFSNMIALEAEGESQLGVVHFPMLNETLYATRGGGTWCRGFNKKDFEQVRMSETKDLSQARMTCSNYNYFKRAGKEKLFAEISNHVKFMHGYADSYGQLLVATGRVDFMLDPVMYHWDIMPFKVIIEEAGGLWTDFKGNVTAFSDDAFSANKHLHPQILEIIKRCE